MEVGVSDASAAEAATEDGDMKADRIERSSSREASTLPIGPMGLAGATALGGMAIGGTTAGATEAGTTDVSMTDAC